MATACIACGSESTKIGQKSRPHKWTTLIPGHLKNPSNWHLEQSTMWVKNQKQPLFRAMNIKIS